MNYCQSCRRHLNGAVSCPGCGAVDPASPEVRDSRSTEWMTEAAWPERDPLPGAETHGAAAGSGKRANRDVARAGFRSAARAKGLAGPAGGGSRTRANAGESPQAAPRPALRGKDKPADREAVRTRNSGADSPTGRDDRRSRKRRGLGLGVTLTGGFAGIIITGLLILGNLPTTSGAADPVNAIATVSTSASHGPGTISSPDAPTPTGTGIGSRAMAPSNASASATSPSPNSSTASRSPSSSTTPAPGQSSTSTQAGQPTSPSTAPSSAQSSPTATQSTTSPASPSPSPSHTHVSCILIICW